MIEEVFLRVTLILFFVAYIINIHTCFKTMKELEDFKIEMRLMMHSINKEREKWTKN